MRKRKGQTPNSYLSPDDTRRYHLQMGAVIDQRDTAEANAVHWEGEAIQRGKEAEQAAGERDAFAAWALPRYGDSTIQPTAAPVDALIGNELAAKYGGWTS